MSLKIRERFITKNPCFTTNKIGWDERYKSFQSSGAQGATLHSIGVNQPSAEVIANNFDKPNAEAAVHAVVPAEGDVLQLMPWNYRGWHVAFGANGSANNTHVGVEMTEPSCISYDADDGYKLYTHDRAAALDFVKKTYAQAVELFAWLCAKFRWNPLGDGVILSHKECHARGIGSNHGDPEHLWDALGTGYTMNTFRAAVAERLEEMNMKRYTRVEEMPAWAQEEIKELIDADALRGDENGNLDLSEDMVRMLIINKRYSEALRK